MLIKSLGSLIMDICLQYSRSQFSTLHIHLKGEYSAVFTQKMGLIIKQKAGCVGGKKVAVDLS